METAPPDILVVDDNSTKRYTTARLLKAKGFPVIEAETGEEALRLVRERSFGLVVLDVKLPDLDGFEVCRRIRADPAHARLPILHLTGHHTSREDQVHGLDEGADSYLLIPVEPDILIATVRGLLRKSADQKELERANKAMEVQVTERTQTLIERTKALEVALAERKQLARSLVDAQEKERGRISRELHDQTGQLLTGLSLELRLLRESLQHLLPQEERTLPDARRSEVTGPLARLHRLEATVAELGRQVHQIAVELRPPSLDDLGLIPALEAYMGRWSAHTGIEANLQSVGVSKPQQSLRKALPPSPQHALNEITIYRIVQEALTNVARHADGARSVNITILNFRDSAGDRSETWRRPTDSLDNAIQVTIEDDGCGFDPAEAAKEGRLGLTGMRERAALAGGTLDVESSQGVGTVIYLRLPVIDSKAV